ncbi:response regulator [Oceanispirochaeta sp.]|jgi:DNA-binding response OmpR family regulator|uniref:response regulator n=1 Tax=Oceanispirochaeta sp. TaxID=2035350 RepID=UPI00262002DD|nr:response regulator [Oceanispirochaeta sp.]MDA3955269.1 response regulator [Oceanispirochaeta sp.]
MAHILVIDDDVHIRELINIMLESEGHTVVLAEDGMVGLQMIDKETFDLIITDIIMPNQEGIETIVQIKAKSPDTKILAISGGGRIGSTNYLSLAENFGVDKTLSKPFYHKDFIDCIKKLID